MADETLYPQLGDKRRGELTEIAGRRAEQARIDEETTRVRDDREAAAAKAQAARVFATGFGAKLRQGSATAVEIGVAEADGVIDRADADRPVQRLRDDEAARTDRARLGEIARLALTRGKGLDASDPEQASAAGVHFDDVLRPALLAARTDDEIEGVRAAILDLAIVPPSLSRQLDIMWRSGDPRLPPRRRW